MSHWANDYIGLPWSNGAQGPEAFDCFGLVRHVYREHLGIDLPAVAVDAQRPIAVRHAFADPALHAGWRRVRDGYADLDVLELSLATKPHHVGLWLHLDGGGVLSAVEGAGVVFQSRASLAAHGWNIIAGYRREEC